MNDRFIVYGLVDPRTRQLRYIGKSSTGMKRARSHAYPGYLKRDRSYCGNWIRELLREGLRYEVAVFQRLSDGEILADAERFWIAYFRRMGCPLTNLTDGGEGCLGRVVSEETRRKLREANIGNTNSAGKKRALTVEQRFAMAEAARRRSADPAIRAKISATLVGQKQSSEQIARRLATTKARWAKVPKKPFSEETKKKMSESAKRRHAREKLARSDNGRH